MRQTLQELELKQLTNLAETYASAGLGHLIECAVRDYEVQPDFIFLEAEQSENPGFYVILDKAPWQLSFCFSCGEQRVLSNVFGLSYYFELVAAMEGAPSIEAIIDYCHANQLLFNIADKGNDIVSVSVISISPAKLCFRALLKEFESFELVEAGEICDEDTSS
jgi:hypothetical protein